MLWTLSYELSDAVEEPMLLYFLSKRLQYDNHPEEPSYT